MDNFPARLKKAMRYRGFRQIDLANETGIDRGTISYYISGKFKPKARNILLIAEALKVNAPWLLGEDEVPMEIDPSTEIVTSELDYYKTAYIKLEYSDVVEMNISQEEWNILYDEFARCSDNFKADILKYLYLVFAMDEMINQSKEKENAESEN